MGLVRDTDVPPLLRREPDERATGTRGRLLRAAPFNGTRRDVLISDVIEVMGHAAVIERRAQSAPPGLPLSHRKGQGHRLSVRLRKSIDRRAWRGSSASG